MTAQLIELLFFAGIAFLIISKLISTLGTTSEEDGAKKRSYFGENISVKDVTPSRKTPHVKAADVIDLFGNPQAPVLVPDNIILESNKEAILKGLAELQNKSPAFNPAAFLRSATVAFKMIIEYASGNVGNLAELVDKRYLDQFKEISQSYGLLNPASEDVEAKISEIYMFGNNVFIKVLFAGRNLVSKIQDFHEEWTFSKSLISIEPNWYLTNIDRPQ